MLHGKQVRMISVVIPTLDAERNLGRTLSALVPAAVDGLVREVIVADGGSKDATLKIADEAGAAIVTSDRGRGTQLKAGAASARFPWLLFVHADTVLEPGWVSEAGDFIDRVSEGRRDPAAAAFHFTLDDEGLAPRLIEHGVSLRTRALGWPYGDQGLLIPRTLYDEVGGYAELPIMEDIDLVRRIGRKRLALFRTRAVTSAERYRRDGYARRSLRNLMCVSMFVAGVSPARIARLYDREGQPPAPRSAR